MAAAAAYALVVGALSLRTRGVYFIMVTLAFAQMAYFVFHDTPARRRHRRHLPVLQADARDRRATLLDLDNALAFYYFVLACLVAVFALPRAAAALALRPRAGRHPRQRAAHARGRLLDLRRTSSPPSSLAGALAGLAGFLFAVKDGFVNPELLCWHQSGAVLLMIILGGIGHLRGAVLGAFAFALLQELFQSEALFGALRQALAARRSASRSSPSSRCCRAA